MASPNVETRPSASSSTNASKSVSMDSMTSLDSTLTESRSTSTSNQSSKEISTGSLPFTQFVWGAGIECSFLPHLNVDQFEWTQHDRFWKEDFRRAKEEAGITNIRYALPWHLLEPEPGKFDWGMADERGEYVSRLGIDLLMDGMHLRTPRWLKQAGRRPPVPASPCPVSPPTP